MRKCGEKRGSGATFGGRLGRSRRGQHLHLTEVQRFLVVVHDQRQIAAFHRRVAVQTDSGALTHRCIAVQTADTGGLNALGGTAQSLRHIDVKVGQAIPYRHDEKQQVLSENTFTA